MCSVGERLGALEQRVDMLEHRVTTTVRDMLQRMQQLSAEMEQRMEQRLLAFQRRMAEGAVQTSAGSYRPSNDMKKHMRTVLKKHMQLCGVDISLGVGHQGLCWGVVCVSVYLHVCVCVCVFVYLHVCVCVYLSGCTRVCHNL